MFPVTLSQHLATIHNVTDDRRNSVAIARPLVRSAKNHFSEHVDEYLSDLSRLTLNHKIIKSCAPSVELMMQM